MNISTIIENGLAVINLQGRMDAVNAGEYQAAIDALLREGTVKIAVDFSGLEYISSAGLRSILMGGKMVAGKSGALALFGLGGMVKDVFDVSGFSTMFTVLESRQDALTHLGG